METNDGGKSSGDGKKSLSDSILHSYRHEQSTNVSRRPFMTAVSTQSLISRKDSRNMLSRNSDWGANASFNVIQRSAAVKQDVILCISKINKSLAMIQNLHAADCANGDHVINNPLQNQHDQQENCNHNHQNLIGFCTCQVTQNVSKLALYVQDDYYRIIIGNMNGIIENNHSIHEILSHPIKNKSAATWNLTLVIVYYANRSPLYINLSCCRLLVFHPL